MIRDTRGMPVVEIFNSIEGETHRTGRLVTFIRFAGCNLKCKWCDTPYAIHSDSGNRTMSINQICKEVFDFGSPLVTITGGEPLIQPHINELVKALLEQGHQINIETNGSISLDVIYRKKNDRLFFSIDRKLAGSGQKSKMLLNKTLTEDLHKDGRDCIKYVISNEDEFEEVYDHICDINHRCNKLKKKQPTHYLSPCWGFDASKIVDFMKAKGLAFHDVRLQVQLHKIVWDKDKRGV